MRKGSGLVWVGAALLVAALVGCERPKEEAPHAAPPAVASRPVWTPDAGAAPPAASDTRHESLPPLVLNFEGTVEVRRAGTEGWVALKIGDAIRAGDTVRTAPDARFSFSFGQAQVRMQPGSEVRVEALDPMSIRLAVAGLVEAERPDGGQRVELTGVGGGPVTSLESGILSVASDTGGGLTLAASQGEVQVQTGGESLALRQDEFTSLEPGRPPSRPRSIPARVTLRVRWPARAETNRPQLALRGTASLLSTVEVNGRKVQPDADGNFTAELHLRRGRQRIQVEARDVLGRKATQGRVLTFDPDAPSIKGEVEYP